jgi:hypothetical protein
MRATCPAYLINLICLIIFGNEHKILSSLHEDELLGLNMYKQNSATDYLGTKHVRANNIMVHYGKRQSSPATHLWWRWGDRTHSQRHAPALTVPPVTTVQEAGCAPDPVSNQRLQIKSLAPAGDRTSIARLSSPLQDTTLTELPGFHHTS